MASKLPARPGQPSTQVVTGRPNIHKQKRKNSQASREGGHSGISPESVYTQVALKPDVVKSKSRSRDPNPNAGVKRVPQASTLSAGKISR